MTILAELMQGKEPPTSMGREPAINYVRYAVLGILYADNGCIILLSPRGLAKMNRCARSEGASGRSSSSLVSMIGVCVRKDVKVGLVDGRGGRRGGN